MLLSFDDGSPFARGACTYLYRPATEGEKSQRIFVNVRIEGFPTSAVVDTGGVYLICPPDVARELNLDPTDAVGSERVNIRGRSYQGALHRLSLHLVASEGAGIVMEATAFVPHLKPNEPPWDLPLYLGMTGCLERIRFAVDPGTETFYFGDIGWESG